MPTYDDEQLATIRKVIAGLPALTPGDIAARDAAVAEGRCTVELWPLWPVAQEDAALWDALAGDRHISTHSVYGFFPAAYDLVYGDDDRPAAIRYDGRTRGRVAIITGRRAGAPISVVVKPCQSRREAEIARIAGELEIGPRQLPSIDGFISEEYVAGTFLTDLTPEQATPERMRGIGAMLREALGRLHAAAVCYNDATIADPEGRSHIIIRRDAVNDPKPDGAGGIRLIDFGVALLLRDHPQELSFEDAYNAARTDPMFRLFRQMTGDADQTALGRFVSDYGSRLARQSVHEIQSRDWQIAKEGAAVIATRFGPAAADAVREGLGI